MILVCPEHSFSRPISCRVTPLIPCGFVSRATSSFSPFQAILRKETNIVQKGELQEEVIAKYNKHALRSDGEKDQNKGGTLLQPVSVIAGRPPRGTSIHHGIKQFCGFYAVTGTAGRDHLCQCGPQQDQWT